MTRLACLFLVAACGAAATRPAPSPAANEDAQAEVVARWLETHRATARAVASTTWSASGAPLPARPGQRADEQFWKLGDGDDAELALVGSPCQRALGCPTYECIAPITYQVATDADGKVTLLRLVADLDWQVDKRPGSCGVAGCGAPPRGDTPPDPNPELAGVALGVSATSTFDIVELHYRRVYVHHTCEHEIPPA